MCWRGSRRSSSPTGPAPEYKATTILSGRRGALAPDYLGAKCTRKLLERIRHTREDEPIEVIVRVQDPHALERLEGAKGQAIESVVGAEQRHTV